MMMSHKTLVGPQLKDYFCYAKKLLVACSVYDYDYYLAVVRLNLLRMFASSLSPFASLHLMLALELKSLTGCQRISQLHCLLFMVVLDQLLHSSCGGVLVYQRRAALLR